MRNKQNITINKEQKLYVIPCGNGFSCMGFDVVQKRLKALADELGFKRMIFRTGSMSAYNEYKIMVELAHEKHIASNCYWRSKTELFELFIGNEGKRVEVTYLWGEKERFYIGKSTGFIPRHLMIKQRNSSGGCGVSNDSIKSFKFIS